MLLIGLTTLTLLYSQLAGRIDLSFWWNSLSLRWEEYQQHTDNVSRIQAWQRTLQDSPWRRPKPLGPTDLKERSYLPGFLSGFVAKVRNVTGWVYKPTKTEEPYEPPVNDLKKRFLMDTAPVQLTSDRFKMSTPVALDSGYPSSSAAASSQQFSSNPPLQTFNQGLNTLGSGFQSHKLQTNTVQSNTGPVSQYSQSSNTALQQTPNRVASSWFDTKDLRRRPLRSSSSLKPVPVPSFPATGGQSLRSKFASAFGFGGSWSSKPAGLKNEGQNLCFMNSVVQCLARSPNLVSELSREMKDDIDCSVAESVLVSSFVELLTMCSDKPGKHKVLEPTAFKEAVSVLNNHLVAPTGERQFQQDAAEFIMWLMETLVNILNKKCSQGDLFC